jgi:iron complex outermembrane receptor protein
VRVHTWTGINPLAVNLPARFISALSLLACALAAPPRTLAAQENPRADAERHLHLVLEDASNGQPLGGVEVSVEWLNGAATVRRAARSDRHGHVDIDRLPPRALTLRLRMLGYVAITQLVDLSADDVVMKLRLAPVAVRLSQVSVVADSLADPLGQVASVSSMDRASLDSHRGQTLGETIKHLPGVAVIQLGPSIAKPVVRGLNSQRVVVLSGGLRQEDQQWGTEHAPNMDSFEADAVTVVRGAGTVLYGADALGGVVRVDYKPVLDTGVFRSELSSNLFSNSRQAALSFTAQQGGLQLPWIGRAGYRARLTGRVAGNGATPDYYLANTGFRELNGSLGVGIERPWGSSEVTLSHFGTELGVLTQAHAGNFDDLARAMSEPPTDSGFTYGIARPNQRVSHTTLRWRTVRRRPDSGELELAYGLQFNDRREYDNHGPLRLRSIPAFHLRLFTNTVDVRYTHAPWRGLVGTVGTTAMVQGNQTLGKGFLIPGFDLFQLAAYAQESYSVGRFTFSSGARVDGISQTTIPFDDAGIRSPAGTRAWGGFAGSLGSVYHVTDALDVSVRLARSWRPPTVNERYAQGVHHGSAQYELGDATLDAERSVGLEAAVNFEGRRTAWQAAVYDNRIENFIFLEPRAPVFTLRGAFPAFRYAAAKARMRGVELSGSVTVTPWLSLEGNASTVRGRDLDRNQPLYDMPADRALLTAKFEGASRTLGPWDFSVGAILVRRQDGVPSGTIYTLPTAGYELVQASAGLHSLRVAGRPVDVALSVSNALNARYRDYLSRYRLFVNDAARDVVLRVRMPLF